MPLHEIKMLFSHNFKRELSIITPKKRVGDIKLLTEEPHHSVNMIKLLSHKGWWGRGRGQCREAKGMLEGSEEGDHSHAALPLKRSSAAHKALSRSLSPQTPPGQSDEGVGLPACLCFML